MLGAHKSLGLALLLAACSTPADTPADEPADRLAALFADDMTVVDLTHAVSADAPYWPGPDRSPFVHDTLSAHEDGAPAMAAYAVPEHFGTHFDAPVHGGMGLASVDQVPPSDLFGPAVVVDVTTQVSEDEDYAVTADDIRAWEAVHGEIPAGAIVVMRSGWPSRWAQGDRYYNRGMDNRLHFPGFSEGAALFLTNERISQASGSTPEAWILATLADIPHTEW